MILTPAPLALSPPLTSFALLLQAGHRRSAAGPPPAASCPVPLLGAAVAARAGGGGAGHVDASGDAGQHPGGLQMAVENHCVLGVTVSVVRGGEGVGC